MADLTKAMYEKGESVFFKHPEHSWVCGQIESIDTDKKTKLFIYSCKVQDKVRTETKEGEIVEKVLEADVNHLQADTLEDKPDDLLNLTVLHDSTLIRCLYMRYMSDIIYTNIGAIVVALNPFNFKIPHYMEDQMDKYLAEGNVITKNIPHSWAQAHNTYNEMINDRENQCVLISGESGAGKTEATKIVMKYLGRISCREGTAEDKAAGGLVGTKLSSCSPILEAFGNAKTVRNDNSSRFGKFVKVKFDANGRLIGADTIKYLLEKSRIITASLDERIYHAFYIVARGKFKGQMQLDEPGKYRSLNSGKCMDNSEFNTAEDFQEVCDAMENLGMTEKEIHATWLIPAGILSLQNVKFLDFKDACAIETDSAKYLSHACKLWGVEEAVLKGEFLTTTRNMPGQPATTSANSVTKANDIRDAMCKGMYDGIFGWLVIKCNELCDVPASGNWIGLLDIFGFEDFKFNSFEQICINLTNETLQNHYNGYIFTRDMDECRAEGIDVTDIKCPDNGPCLRMVTDQGGIMPLLDQQCQLGDQGSDKIFTDSVIDKFKNNEFFSNPKIPGPEFTIHHYAASVKYDTVGWVDKNRDTLKDTIKSLIRSSPDPVIAVVLPEPIPEHLKKGKVLTVSGFFISQLKDLMDLINSTNPHWIRCVKPHPAKKARMFHGVQSMNQLESSGVLGTVKIRKAGYPVRIEFDKFIKKFNVLGDAASLKGEACIKAIMSASGIEMPAKAQIGRTKVFLKAEAYQILEKLRIKALEGKIKLMQRWGQGLIARGKMFVAHFEKHKAAILAARKEREDREREAKEAIEREKRENEERERRIREAEERARIAKEKEMREKYTNSAILLQKHVRGMLDRVRVYRTVVEQARADFEYQREVKSAHDRSEVHNFDAIRHRDEKQWLNYLHQVEDLKRFEDQEKVRKEDKLKAKERIIKREQDRKTRALSKDLEEEEYNARLELFAKFVVHLKHRKEMEKEAKDFVHSSAKWRREMDAQGGSPIRRPNASVVSKQAAAMAADQRTKETLADYAVRRAQAFDQYYSQKVAPDFFESNHRISKGPSTSYAASRVGNEPLHGTTSMQSPRAGAAAPGVARGYGVAPGGASSSNPNSTSLFNRSKNRWQRQEEWADSRGPVDGVFHMDPQFGGGARSGGSGMPAHHRRPASPAMAASSFGSGVGAAALSPTSNRYSGPYRSDPSSASRGAASGLVGGGGGSSTPRRTGGISSRLDISSPPSAPPGGSRPGSYSWESVFR